MRLFITSENTMHTYVARFAVLLSAALIGLISASYAQVGIGTTSPDASAQLDIASTSRGLLTPRMSQNEREHISSPATGLLVYQTDNATGFYYYNGTDWAPMKSSGAVGQSKAIISLSAGSKIRFSTGSAGEANALWLVGITSSEKKFLGPFSTPPASVNLGGSEIEPFLVPRSGIVSDLSVAFKVIESTFNFGENAATSSTLTIQLFRCSADDAVFTAVPGAQAIISANGQNLSTYSNPIARTNVSDLGVAVSAGDQLILGLYFSQGGGSTTLFNAQVDGLVSAGISIQ